MTTDPPEFTGRYGLTEAHCAELRKTLELILADVGAWEQSAWGTDYLATSSRDPGDPLVVLVPLAELPASATACGTAFCVAGHYAVSVLGLQPVWRDATGLRLHGRPARFTSYVTDPAAVAPDNPTGQRMIPDVARAGFGLSADAAELLFSQNNSLRRVVDVAWLLTDGRVDLFDAYADLAARDPEFAARELAVERSVRDDVVLAYRRCLEHDELLRVAESRGYDVWLHRLRSVT